MREVSWRLLVPALAAALLAHGAAIAFLWSAPETRGAAVSGSGGLEVSVVAGLPAPPAAPENVSAEPEPEPEPETAEIPPPEPEPEALPVLPAAKPQRPRRAAPPKPEPLPIAEQAAASAKEPQETGREKGTASGARAAEAAPGGGDPGARADYFARLRAHLERHKHYPRRARLRKEEGVVELSLTIGRSGEVLAHEILQSSGFPQLDEAVRQMVADATPLPVPDERAGAAPLTVQIPVTFALR